MANPGRILIAFAVLMGTSCANGESARTGTRVTGRLVDGETGMPVSRRTFWVHGFNDEVDHQVSLEPADESTFSMELPTRDVRLRIFDMERKYELFERMYAAAEGSLDVEVRLAPTHWIRLHGKVLWRDGANLRPPREGDENVRSVMVHVSSSGSSSFRLDLARDGSYSERVPRDLLSILTIDTSRGPTPRQIDLRDATEDERQLDIVLEE
jgi:hypothetical protein